MANLEKLHVYQRAKALSIAVHKAAQRFPRGLAPTLKRQLLRAIESVVSNIAEGAAARTDPERSQFLSHSLKSANEAQGQLETARGLDMLPLKEIDRYLDELDQIRAMTFAYRRRIDERIESEKRKASGGEEAESPSDPPPAP